MRWEHRVRRRHFPVVDSWGCDESYDTFEIVEAYYDLNEGKDGVVTTQEAVTVEGDSLDDLRVTLQWMLAALDKPVIEADPE